MGFYIKDLYVDVAGLRRAPWNELFHDPLTNPPTMPETSPAVAAAVAVAALGTAVVAATEPVRHGRFEALDRVAAEIGAFALTPLLPVDDTTFPPTPPTWPPTLPPPTTPVSGGLRDVLDESDLLQARQVLQAALAQVERAVESLQPSLEQLEGLRSALEVGHSRPAAASGKA